MLSLKLRSISAEFLLQVIRSIMRPVIATQPRVSFVFLTNNSLHFEAIVIYRHPVIALYTLCYLCDQIEISFVRDLYILG